MRFIDLFAGIGGFHLAFHQLGSECVFASEINKYARLTYTQNFSCVSPDLFTPEKYNDDILKITDPKNQILDFDILCAGFPCQSFSNIGLKKGFDDVFSDRGNMFFHVCKIIKAKRPKAFFLENVRGLLNHDEGRTFKIIKEKLEIELGYTFEYKIVKASEYGLPQHRARVFMVGFRKDSDEMPKFQFPKTIPLIMNMSDVLGGECNKKIGYTLRVGGRGSAIYDRRNWDGYIVDGKEVRLSPDHGKK